MERLRGLIEILKELVHAKKTGMLRINLSQGGIADVRFEEKLM